MANTLKILQMIFAVLLVIAVLLQQKGSGLGSAFGGEGNVYRSRRGVEKTLFAATIILAILFCLTAISSVFLN